MRKEVDEAARIICPMCDETKCVGRSQCKQISEYLKSKLVDFNQYEKGYADGKADAMAELVRCKDCTYWDKAVVNKKGFLICPASGMEIQADDFCSYGERRTE